MNFPLKKGKLRLAVLMQYKLNPATEMRIRDEKRTHGQSP